MELRIDKSIGESLRQWLCQRRLEACNEIGQPCFSKLPPDLVEELRAMGIQESTSFSVSDYNFEVAESEESSHVPRVLHENEVDEDGPDVEILRIQEMDKKTLQEVLLDVPQMEGLDLAPKDRLGPDDTLPLSTPEYDSLIASSRDTLHVEFNDFSFGAPIPAPSDKRPLKSHGTKMSKSSGMEVVFEPASLGKLRISQGTSGDRTSGPNSEKASAFGQSVKITLDNEAYRKLREMAENSEIQKGLMTQMLKAAVGATAKYQRTRLADFEVHETASFTKATYALLARLNAMVEFRRILLTRIRAGFAGLPRSDIRHEYEFCFCVDNSGSMNGVKERHARSALVLLMETLRRLECSFSVVRFGGRNSQRVLKDIDEPMGEDKGEQILESFTFNEGTYPADGLLFAVEHGFKRRDQDRDLSPLSPVQVHRAVIMITDGISGQSDPQQYITILRERDVNFAIVQIAGQSERGLESEIKNRLELIVNRGRTSSSSGHNPNYCLVSWNEIKQLLPLLADLLLGQFQQWFRAAETTNKGTESTTSAPSPASPLFASVLQVEGKPKPLKKIEVKGPKDLDILKRTACSTGDAQIPFMESIRLNTVTNDADVQGQMGELSRKSAAWYETLQGEPHRDHLDQAQKMWTATAAELSSEVEDLVSVLKESIMPVNRYTRRRPDFSGSSLHMRSVVRFVLTNFNYKRIFQRRTAGGKHEYRVVVAIDKSSSLMGANGLLLLRGAVAFIMALQKIGLERSTSILTFGERVQLVKHEEQEMDARFMYQMLASRGFTETATMDSDALDASIALLQTSVHQRATPFIFIFSDGYGSQGTRLSESLVKAEQHGITTVAVAIGLEESGVPAAYKDWISCDQPAALSEGLRMWHSGAGPLEPLGEMGKVERMLLTEGSDKTIEQVWNEHRPFFKDLASKLDGERSMYVDAQKENASSFDIDVVFVMDCTGSMGSWIEAGKTQINTIAKNLCSKLEKEYGKTCKPRMAFVGYRDHCDGPMRLQSIDFTTDIDAVCRMVGSMAASGRGVTPQKMCWGVSNRPFLSSGTALPDFWF